MDDHLVIPRTVCSLGFIQELRKSLGEWAEFLCAHLV